MTVEFTIPGIPAPQGSKTPWGSEANPRTRPWRAAVTAEASAAMDGMTLLQGPLMVDVVFTFPRPKGHYGTGRNSALLKPTAPTYHVAKPDGDKLARAVGDALTGTVFRDDSQVARWRILKVYGDKAGATVHVQELR